MTPWFHSTDPPSGGADDDIDALDDQSFDDLEDQVERLARQTQADAASEPRSQVVDDPSKPLRTDEDFEAAVGAAVAGLPEKFQKAMEGVVVVVSDDGASQKAYGMFVGRTAFHDEQMISFPTSYVLPDEIIIYRDTLLRDFGGNPAQLRAEIVRVVRHEVGHHLGLNEDQVRELGL